jgi:hypothetical protein
MSMRIILLGLLISAPLMVQAQAYKCKQPDGSLSFQDRPCLAGAVSSKLSLPPPSEPSESENNSNRPQKTRTQKPLGSENSWQSKEDNEKRRRADEEINAANEKTRIYNKMISCNLARSQLEVAKRGRPAYSLDNKGDRHYIEDENRQSVISSKERIVAQECR